MDFWSPMRVEISILVYHKGLGIEETVSGIPKYIRERRQGCRQQTLDHHLFSFAALQEEEVSERRGKSTDDETLHSLHS